MTQERPEEVPEDVWNELTTKHGELVVIEVDAPEKPVVLARKLPPNEYRRFRARIFDEKKRPDAVEEIARLSILYPGKAVLDGLTQDMPALLDSIGDAILERAGTGKAKLRR